MQTRKQSHLEVLVNQCLGLAGGWLIVYYLFPLFDIYVSFQDNLLIGLYFTVISLIRSYLVRRYFNKKIK